MGDLRVFASRDGDILGCEAQMRDGRRSGRAHGGLGGGERSDASGAKGCDEEFDGGHGHLLFDDEQEVGGDTLTFKERSRQPDREVMP